MERKEELESMNIKQQHKNYIQSLGTSTSYISSTERKPKLELPQNGNKINLIVLSFMEIFSFLLIEEYSILQCFLN